MRTPGYSLTAAAGPGSGYPTHDYCSSSGRGLLTLQAINAQSSRCSRLVNLPMHEMSTAAGHACELVPRYRRIHGGLAEREYRSTTLYPQRYLCVVGRSGLSMWWHVYSGMSPRQSEFGSTCIVSGTERREMDGACRYVAYL
jgi:hypothetical protein